MNDKAATNDKAALAIQSIRDSELQARVMELESKQDKAILPWTKQIILRAELTEVLIGFLRLENDLAKSLGSLAEDKAAKAIEGMTRCPVQETVSSAENKILNWIEDNPDGRVIDLVLDYLRLEIKTLALGYTKLQSDMNALKMQREHDDNFINSMGDPKLFQDFLLQHFRADVLADPTSKLLTVAERIMSRGLGAPVSPDPEGVAQ
jgi:hypothetical protein